MIDTINSLITKKSNVQSIDFNFLFQTNIAIIIISFTTNVDDAFLSIVFKDKLINLNEMRFYKDLNIDEYVR